MNTQFKKGVVELCVLKMIEYHSMSSFEVLEHIRHDLDVNENTVYPILRRLTNDGLLEVNKKESLVGAPRKYYTLTSDGSNQLKQLETDWNDFVTRVSSIMRGENYE